jgi:hypothetical protein
MTLTITGALAVLIGAILWGDADAEVRSLAGRIDSLRHPLPEFSFGPDGMHLSLRGHF